MSARSSFLAAVLAIAALPGAAWCQAQAESRASGDNGRIEKLASAILNTRSSSWCHKRALQELAVLAPKDANARDLLLAYFVSESADIESVSAMAGLDYASVSKIVSTRIASAREDAGAYYLTLHLLGSMGPKAKEAVPLLLDALKRNEVDPRLACTTRVVLCILGHDSNVANAAALRDELTSGSDEAWRALNFLMNVRAAGLIGEDIVAEYAAKHLDPNEPRRFQCIRYLGMLGVKAKPMVPELKNILRQASKAKETANDGQTSNLPRWVEVHCLVALAIILEDKRTDYLRQFCRGASRIGNHTDWAAFSLIDHADPKMLDAVIGLVSDKEDAVAIGATMAVMEIGIPARKAQKALWDLLTQDRDEEARNYAARALGCAADLSYLPLLRARLEKEVSDEIQKAISEAIDTMELRESKP